MPDNKSQYIDIEDRNEFSKEFWDNVAELKRVKGYSLPKLAEKGNIVYATLASAFWNKENSAPTLKMMLGLSSALGVPPANLLQKDLHAERYGDASSRARGKKGKGHYIPSESALTLSMVLRNETSELSAKQMDSVLVHALSYLDISKEDLHESSEEDDEVAEQEDVGSGREQEKMNAVADMILSTMNKKGLTKTRLAHMAGISYTPFKTLESGNSNPDLQIVLKLANVLEIPYPILFGSMEQAMKDMQKKDLIRQIRYSEMLIDSGNYAQRISALIPLLNDQELDCLKTHIRLLCKR